MRGKGLLDLHDRAVLRVRDFDQARVVQLCDGAGSLEEIEIDGAGQRLKLGDALRPDDAQHALAVILGGLARAAQARLALCAQPDWMTAPRAQRPNLNLSHRRPL